MEKEDLLDTLASIADSLENISLRLDKLEATHPKERTLSVHPSLDKFAIAEAIVEEVFAAQSKEKACAFEANAKPCDHCSMCASRGF